MSKYKSKFMKDGFFFLPAVMSYNKFFMFIIGRRNAGKTYSGLDYAIRDFKKTGKMFIYLRRYDDELKTTSLLFEDVQKKHDVIVEKKGWKFYISKAPVEEIDEETGEKVYKTFEGQVFGYVFDLAHQQSYKGLVAPEVNKIFFDEFIIENTSHRYIPDEVNQLISLWFSVDRNRGTTKLFCFSNAPYISNPYFEDYEVTLEEFDSRSIKKDVVCYRGEMDDIVFINLYDPEGSENLNKSLIGRVSSEKYKRYAIYNEFMDSSDDFIVKQRPKHFEYVATITNGKLELDLYKHNRKTKHGHNNTLWVSSNNIKGTNKINCDKTVPVLNAPYHKDYINYLKAHTHKNLVTYDTPEARYRWFDLIKP